MTQPVIGSLACATFDFTGADRSELTFLPGDLWQVKEQVNPEWQRGLLGDREGIYPVGFAVAAEVAIAVADYDSDVDGDLSFKKGDRIVITRRVNAEWLEGSNSTSNKDGIFPKNFVDFEDPKDCGCAYSKALFEYQAQQDDELSFEAGSFVLLLEKISNEWFKGGYAGAIGIFPANFVEVQKECKSGSVAAKSSKAAPFQAAKQATVPPPKKAKPVIKSPPLKPPPPHRNSIPPPSISPKDKPVPPLARAKPAERPKPVPKPKMSARATTTETDEPVAKPKPAANPKPAPKKRTPVPPAAKPKPPKGKPSSPPKPAAREKGPTPAPKARNMSKKPERPPSQPSRPRRHPTILSIPNKGEEEDDDEEEIARKEAAKVEIAINEVEDLLEAAAEKHAGFLAIINHMESSDHIDQDARANVVNLMNEAKVEVDKLEDRLLELYSKREERNKIIQEILETERDLYSDLKLCIEGYLSPKSLLTTAKDTEGNQLLDDTIRSRLFGNIDDVLAVSGMIMSGLEETMKRDHEGMFIGRVFCQVAPRMKDVYVTYVLNFNDATAALNEVCEDPALKSILALCHETVANRTKCWDLNSFIIKPVQRVLKYPLLLREMLRKTSENHPDYEQLCTAVELLNEVASSINEKKRTEELIDRYVQKQEVRNPHGLIHSIGKKGMRFNQMLRMKVSSAGEGYEEYAQHEKALRDIEADCKRVKKLIGEFLKSKDESTSALELYTKSLYEFLLGKHFSSTTSQEDSSRMSDLCITLTNITISIRKHIDLVRQHVVESVETILVNLHNPLLLVGKRADKRLDYESYKRRFEMTKDIEKRLTLEDGMKLAQNTFTALHNQLADDLPKLNKLCLKTLASCMQTFAVLHMELSENVSKEIEKLEHEFQNTTNHNDLLSELHAALTPVSFSMSAVSIKRSSSASGPAAQPRPTPASRSGLRQDSEAQAANEAESFGKLSVAYDFEAENDTEITLRAGDNVSVLERCDDQGNTDWCKVEASDGRQGYVPTAFLSSDSVDENDDDDIVAARADDDLKVTTAAFDYDADGEGELTVIVGQQLSVVSYEDPHGNSDWTLVRDDSGNEGYVPTNHLDLD